MKDDESVSRTLTSPNCAFHVTEEHFGSPALRGWLTNRNEDVVTKNWKELPNTIQKHFHVLFVRFRKPGTCSLILIEGKSLNLRSFFEKP